MTDHFGHNETDGSYNSDCPACQEKTEEIRKKLDEIARDDIASIIRKFGWNEYIAADEVLRYLEFIAYRARSYDV